MRCYFVSVTGYDKRGRASSQNDVEQTARTISMSWLGALPRQAHFASRRGPRFGGHL